MAKFHPPENFNFTKPNEWPEWKSRFARFRVATKLTKESEAVQVASLIYAMGKDAEHVFRSFTFVNDADKDKFDPVMLKFDNHFIPKRNTIHERALFHRRVQLDEPVEAFIRALYDLAEHCNFADKDEQIRDRIVIGLKDRETSEKLQLIETLDLTKAIEIARQAELIKLQMNDQGAAASASEVSVNAVRYKGKKTPQRIQSSSSNCQRCKKGKHQLDKCPAKDKTCYKCKKLGHFAYCCKTKKEVNEVQAAMQDLFFGSVSNENINTNDDYWNVDLLINRSIVKFKIDTGADASIISKEVYKNLKEKPKLELPAVKLHSPGGELACLGQFNAKCNFKGKEYSFTIFVVDSVITSLLGGTTANQLGLVKRIHQVNVFGELGLMKTEPVKIKLRCDAQPYCLTSPRRIPFPLLNKVKEEIDRMCEMGVISNITEATEWCAPMVPVVKKNGKIRLCVDLKQLNKSVQREVYILPTVEDISYKLKGCDVFSTLDCSSSFWQLPLDKASAKLTTFITPFGRFYFNRLPYGLASATEIFQRKLSELLADMNGVFVDIDDILIHAKGMEEHNKILEAVLYRIQDAGLKLNKGKCKFRQRKCYATKDKTSVKMA